MPNAEGRMEDDVQAALDLFSKSVAFGLLRPYPPEEAAWRTIHAALAAARAENERMRESINRALGYLYSDRYNTKHQKQYAYEALERYEEAEAMERLAAQEGTR